MPGGRNTDSTRGTPCDTPFWDETLCTPGPSGVALNPGIPDSSQIVRDGHSASELAERFRARTETAPDSPLRTLGPSWLDAGMVVFDSDLVVEGTQFFTVPMPEEFKDFSDTSPSVERVWPVKHDGSWWRIEEKLDVNIPPHAPPKGAQGRIPPADAPDCRTAESDVTITEFLGGYTEPEEVMSQIFFRDKICREMTQAGHFAAVPQRFSLTA